MESNLESRPSKARESAERKICNQILQAVEDIAADVLDGSYLKIASDKLGRHARYGVIRLNLDKSVFSETSRHLEICQPIGESVKDHLWMLRLTYFSPEFENKYKETITLGREDSIYLYDHWHVIDSYGASPEIGLSDGYHQAEGCAAIKSVQSGYNVFIPEQELQAILKDLKYFLKTGLPAPNSHIK